MALVIPCNSLTTKRYQRKTLSRGSLLASSLFSVKVRAVTLLLYVEAGSGEAVAIAGFSVLLGYAPSLLLNLPGRSAERERELSLSLMISPVLAQQWRLTLVAKS